MGELIVVWVNMSRIIHDSIVVLHDKVRVIPGIQLPAGAEHTVVMEPVE